jgi:asparagine synthase (glutamine-hydrolysing)
MCGIIGAASTRPLGELAWLTAGRDALAHRGPDDAGLWHDPTGRAALGHRRLSILDLTPAGHQPMTAAGGRQAIAFNGEIYNYRELQAELAALGHRFTSGSDTEVLLAAYGRWGPACLDRLNGMFAFAIVDTAAGTLFLARDRAGEKPLFYEVADGELRFASELKGLLAAGRPRRIDPTALDLLLFSAYAPGDHTLVAGIRQLPPAHALSFDLASGALTTWRYWSLPPAPRLAADPVELLTELERLLADAVRRQLVADVPVGLLLSGGVDSSVITALAARAAPDVRTFTVGFPGAGVFDERPHARLVAAHFGTRHTELEAGDVSPELLPLLARQFDNPVIDSSMLPTYLVTKLVKAHCAVALGGDGGDELFGGYANYGRYLAIARYAGRLPLSLRKRLARAGAALPPGVKGRGVLQTLGFDFARSMPLMPALFDRAARARLVAPGAGLTLPLTAERLFAARVPPGPDLLQRMTRMDFENYLPADILAKVDRASMLNSLEVRAPFLDPRVVAFAYGRVPSALKAAHGEKKILLKRLAARLLPPGFDLTRKMGFSIPLDAWLARPAWRAYFSDVLFDPGCLFSRAAVDALWAEQDRGVHNGERLFALVILELWRRAYGLGG